MESVFLFWEESAVKACEVIRWEGTTYYMVCVTQDHLLLYDLREGRKVDGCKLEDVQCVSVRQVVTAGEDKVRVLIQSKNGWMLLYGLTMDGLTVDVKPVLRKRYRIGQEGFCRIAYANHQLPSMFYFIDE